LGTYSQSLFRPLFRPQVSVSYSARIQDNSAGSLTTKLMSARALRVCRSSKSAPSHPSPQIATSPRAPRVFTTSAVHRKFAGMRYFPPRVRSVLCFDWQESVSCSIRLANKANPAGSQTIKLMSARAQRFFTPGTSLEVCRGRTSTYPSTGSVPSSV